MRRMHAWHTGHGASLGHHLCTHMQKAHVCRKGMQNAVIVTETSTGWRAWYMLPWGASSSLTGFLHHRKYVCRVPVGTQPLLLAVLIGNDRVKGHSGPGDLFIELVMDNTKLTIMARSIPQCVALGLRVRSWVLLCGAENGTWGVVVHAPNPSTLNRGQGGQRNLSSRSA